MPSSKRLVRTGFNAIIMVVVLATQVFSAGLDAVKAAPAASPQAAASPMAEPRPLSAPTAQVGLSPVTARIGEDFIFTVTFQNGSTDIGYGPFMDLVLPVNGSDSGIDPYTPDGIDTDGTIPVVTYLGQAIPASDIIVTTFADVSGSACVTHPLLVDSSGNHILVCDHGQVGDRLLTIRLPFGSFVPSQPAVSISVSTSLSELADLDKPLSIWARGGYQFGATPENDFCCGDAPDQFTSGWTGCCCYPDLIDLQQDLQRPRK